MLVGQNKKGIEAGGFSIIIAVVLLLFTFGILLAEVNYIASKVDENFQVELCRIFNEIKFGVRETTPGKLVISGEPICNTIDKHSNKKSFVPTSKYQQNKEGAEQEIREMIKNCWYMWLEGSKPNMFREYPFGEGCFTCYTFKIKENVNDVTFSSLEKSMEYPYYVKDMSDKCAPLGGGYWKAQCQPDEEVVLSKKTPPTDYKCCSKDVRNECENKGGECHKGVLSEDYVIYNKWSCLKTSENCYVKKEGEGGLYSYTRYIREFGTRKGDIFFMPSGGRESGDISYVPREIYAINFISPSKQFCYRGIKETETSCYIAVGGYVIGVVGAIAGGYALIGGGVATSVAGTAASGAIKSLSFLGLKGGLVTFSLYELGVLGNIAKILADAGASLITVEVPNFIIVSTLNDAKALGCTQNYAE